jgi:hypothetical protein
LQNLANLGFYESLAKWLESQTISGNFPVMENDKIPQKIEAQSTGYLQNAFDGNNARYQIQCRLIYLQRRI